jgi:hypothetical protein
MKAFLDRRLPDIVLGVVILLVATLLWFSGGSPSRAQTPQCGALAEVLAGLASRYNEVVVADGEAGGGRTLLITATPDGATWSAVMVQGDMACLVSAGTNWRDPTEPAGEGI